MAYLDDGWLTQFISDELANVVSHSVVHVTPSTLWVLRW